MLAAALITALSVAWVGTYFALGLYVSAAIPFAYQVVSVVNLVLLAKTKQYRFFRTSQLTLTLLLPFALQLSVGGFIESSGVVLWSFTCPLGALLFSSRREAAWWFAAFGALVLLSATLDPWLWNEPGQIPSWIRTSFFALNICAVTATCYLLLHYFVGERDDAALMVATERERSERLLLNVLPPPIAERLKAGESPIADGFPEVGVLFADIAGFTPLSTTLPPQAIVRMLNEVFTKFDELAAEGGLEKIKTVGDAYMVASGLLIGGPDHLHRLALMASSMLRAVRSMNGALELRIGIDVGPVVAGVIGRNRFIYDLWGDTVNTASRMESHGVPGAVHVTERVRAHLAHTFEFEDRGTIDVKGKGPMRTYLLK